MTDPIDEAAEAVVAFYRAVREASAYLSGFKDYGPMTSTAVPLHDAMEKVRVSLDRAADDFRREMQHGR